MRDRYSLVVGLIFVAVIAVAAINTLGHKDEGTLGLDEVAQRWPLPEFAVPDAAGRLEGDANVAQDDCETAPDALPGRRLPRASLRGPHRRRTARLRLLRQAPGALVLVLARAATASNSRMPSSRVYERYRGRVNFLSLDIRDDRGTVRELIRDRGWRMPVGYDRDGAVGSLYRVGGCPTFAYVYPGGTLQSASIGELTAAQLSSHVHERCGRAARVEAG